MLRSSISKRNEIIAAAPFVLVAAGTFMCVGGSLKWLPYHSVIGTAGAITLSAAVALIGTIIIIFLYSHGIHKGGWKYFCRHYGLVKNLRTELLDAGFYVTCYIGQEEVAVLPKITVTFNDDLRTGEVKIQRRLKHGKRLEDLDISASLGRYIVEQSYVSLDGNYFLYDIFDSSFDRQLRFDSCAEYLKAVKAVGDYSLYIDSVTTIPLHHSLICGQTGSGKSYLVEILIVQMLNKNVKYNLYFCDPKCSDIARIGSNIAPARTADTIEGIIGLLRNFHADMKKRMNEMKDLSVKSPCVNISYKDLGYAPCVMIFDEYLAFALALPNCEKKIRDEVSSILSDIVLMGRQCGCFIWLIMQSAPATQIPTFIRDQMVWKVVLGNSDRSTYTVTFDSAADIPTRKFSLGYGVFTYAGLTEKPQIFASPTIKNFDILDAVSGVYSPLPVM